MIEAFVRVTVHSSNKFFSIGLSIGFYEPRHPEVINYAVNFPAALQTSGGRVGANLVTSFEGGATSKPDLCSQSARSRRYCCEKCLHSRCIPHTRQRAQPCIFLVLPSWNYSQTAGRCKIHSSIKTSRRSFFQSAIESHFSRQRQYIETYLEVHSTDLKRENGVRSPKSCFLNVPRVTVYIDFSLIHDPRQFL